MPIVLTGQEGGTLIPVNIGPPQGYVAIALGGTPLNLPTQPEGSNVCQIEPSDGDIYWRIGSDPDASGTNNFTANQGEQFRVQGNEIQGFKAMSRTGSNVNCVIQFFVQSLPNV